MSIEKEALAPLTEIGIREHASLVGLLSERNELQNCNALYVVSQKAPKDAWAMTQIDSGVMLIALTERLGGNAELARVALQNATWSHMRNYGVDLTNKNISDISMAIPNSLLKRWQDQKAGGPDWLPLCVTAAYNFLHQTKDNEFPFNSLTREEGAYVFGKIGGDIWRLYAGTLSVLGDSCSRHFFGDYRD